MSDRCDHVQRVPVHPSVRVGGVSFGRCARPAFPRLTVCFEHATKDALAYLARQLIREVAARKAGARRARSAR